MKDHLWVDKDLAATDNLMALRMVLRFVEDTANNYCVHPLSTGEYGYTQDGWAGMAMILCAIREGMEVIETSLPPDV